jgi:hypothetical protein
MKKEPQHRLVIEYHSIDEWCEKRADQALRVGCSDSYIKKLVAGLRKSYALPETRRLV